MDNYIIQPPIKKHTAFQTLLLHLLPGLVLLLVMIILIPFAKWLGFGGLEGYFAGNLGIIVAMLPLQFGILLYTAKKIERTDQISKLIPFQEKSKPWEYLIFILVILAWSLVVSALLSPLENGLRDGLFRFIPDAVAMRNIDVSALPKDKLIFLACFSIFANGIIAPVIEELYFRGYLLPRINLSPKLAVLANAALFSAYHFFSPWYFFSRLLMMLPIYYWVMKRKNIRFSLIAHLIANITTGVSLLLSVI